MSKTLRVYVFARAFAKKTKNTSSRLLCISDSTDEVMGCGQEKNEACSDDERSTSRARFSDAGDDDNIERVLSGRELQVLCRR